MVRDDFGLSQKEIEKIEKYGRENNLSRERIELLKRNHKFCQEESRRLGVYEKSAEAVPCDQTGMSLVKTGVCQ